MSSTKRGLLIFATALLTILLWAPISGQGGPRPGGGTINHIYFGLFGYLTVRSEIKDPKYELTKTVDAARLAVTAASTAILWAGVILVIKKRAR